MERAASRVAVMRPPLERQLRSIISACAKGDDAEKALQLLAVVQRMGLEPDAITHNALKATMQ